MALVFPDSPNVGDTTTTGGRTWSYDGSGWVPYLIDTASSLTFSHLDTVVSTNSTSSSTSGSISPSTDDVLLATYLVGSGTGMNVDSMTIASTLSNLSGWNKYGIVVENSTNSLIIVVFWAWCSGAPGSGTITCGGVTSSRRILHIDKVVGAKSLYPIVNTASTSQLAASYSSDPNVSLTGATNDSTGTYGVCGFRDDGGNTSTSISNRTSGGGTGPYTTLGNDRALATGTSAHRLWTGYQTSRDTTLYSFVESDATGDVTTAAAVLLAVNDQTVMSDYGFPG